MRGPAHGSYRNSWGSLKRAPGIPVAAAHPEKAAETTTEDQTNENSIWLYKTELCRSYSDSGTCRYGAKCRFAHGKEELRAVTRHKKYKTEKCKNFFKNGICFYGSRCKFIHDDTEEAAAAVSINHSYDNKATENSLGTSWY